MSPFEILENIINNLFSIHKRPVIILIDNFEYPLLAALKGGIVNEAYAFYQKVFPAILVENPNVLKVVTMGMVQVEIPGTICSKYDKLIKGNLSLIQCLNQV